MSYLDPNRISCNCAKSSFEARKLFVVVCCYNRRFPVTKAVGVSYKRWRRLRRRIGGRSRTSTVELEIEDVEEEIDLVSDRVNDSGGAELFAPENTVIIEKHYSQNHLL